MADICTIAFRVTQGQRQDPGLCNNNADTSTNHRLMMMFSVLANDEQGHKNVYSGHKSAAQHDPGSHSLHPTNLVLDIMVCQI